MKNFSWRLAIVVAVIVAAVIYVLPTIHMRLQGLDQPTLWPGKKINLGLDLQGGMHLVLEVDTIKAVESTIGRIQQEMQEGLKEEGIKGIQVEIIAEDPKTKIRVVIKKDESVDPFNQFLDDEFSNLRIISRTKAEILLNLPDSEVKRIKKWATEQALETIRNRIDQFGVSEPDIRSQGARRILIQLPGVKDPERAKDLLGKTALLEFKLLDENTDPREAEEGKVPSGYELLYQITKNRETDRESKTPFLVKKRTEMSGAYLTDARVEIDSQYNESYVSIKFSNKGAKLFARITGANVKKRLAIVLDNKVYSAPVIQEKITGGEARISGSFTPEEARDLAIILRAGALPAPVNILEERTVGASLGEDSIQNGKISVWVGGVLVILFMLIYYNLSGLIADIALGLNILLIAGGLAAFEATLTLPGIAGIILTIGMAVDANVLVYERIKEELRLGKSAQAAVNAGYERATLTVLDANVTTLIAALILFQFGTGPIKGFAITLSLGVISSLFTSLVFSKVIFDYLVVKLKWKTLRI